MAQAESEAFKLSSMDKRSLRDTASVVHREVDMAAEIHCQLTDSQKYALAMSNQLRKDGTRLALGDDLKHAEDKFKQALKVDEKAFGDGSSLVMEDCYALKMISAGLHQSTDRDRMSYKIDRYLQATIPALPESMTNRGIWNGRPIWNGAAIPRIGMYGSSFAEYLERSYELPPLQRHYDNGQVLLTPEQPQYQYPIKQDRYPYPRGVNNEGIRHSKK